METYQIVSFCHLATKSFRIRFQGLKPIPGCRQILDELP